MSASIRFSEKHPNTKDRALYIALDTPTGSGPYGFFTSGDVIRGNVRVTPTSRPQRIVIHFKGRSKSSIVKRSGNSSHTYADKVSLFSHTLELFRSEHWGQSYDIANHGINESGWVMLPFEFTFPDKVELDPSQSDMNYQRQRPQYRERAGFECKAGHPLPPTYQHNKGARCEQYVEYFLEALSYASALVYPSSDIVRQSLRFMPPQPLLEEDTSHLITSGLSTWRFQTHRLHPSYDPNEGLRKRIKFGMKKNDASTPYAYITIKANIPRTVGIDTMFRDMTISFAHKERSAAVTQPPDVFIRQVRVQLNSTVHTRMPYEGSDGDRDMSSSGHREANILDRRFDLGQGHLLYDGMRFEELNRNRPRAMYQTPDAPDFKSYGLNLMHTIAVWLWLECAGERREVMLCRGPIKIVSGIYPALREEVRDIVRQAEEDAVEGILPPPLIDGEEDLPPPYEPPPYEA